MGGPLYLLEYIPFEKTDARLDAQQYGRIGRHCDCMQTVGVIYESGDWTAFIA